MLDVSSSEVEVVSVDSQDFLEVKQFNGLGVEKKQTFLELFARNPNFTECARILGHPPATVYLAMQRDDAFKAEFERVKSGLCDQLEARVYEYAQRPQNFMDRIAYLRAFRPSVWNQQANVNVTHSVEVVHSLADKARQYQATKELEGGERQRQKENG